MFDGSKSEADILQTVSSARYSGLLLYREEVSMQLCVLRSILLQLVSLHQHTTWQRMMPFVVDELCMTEGCFVYI